MNSEYHYKIGTHYLIAPDACRDPNGYVLPLGLRKIMADREIDPESLFPSNAQLLNADREIGVPGNANLLIGI